MTFQRDAFEAWMTQNDYSRNTLGQSVYQLRQIDRFAGDLDAKIAAEGTESVLKWAKNSNAGPFQKYPNQARFALKKYLEFRIQRELPGEANDEVPSESQDASSTPTIFKLEKEMQAAVRKQLHLLEVGLQIDDGGDETQVATGRIDILAKDESGSYVVIELKAGLCPSGALEQVLGCAQALSEERGKPVRACLIAAEFPDRLMVAARRARDLELRTYEFSMTFHTPQ